MPVYEVTVEKVLEWTLNIQANNEESAKHEAKCLAAGYRSVMCGGQVTVKGTLPDSARIDSIARPGECPTDICDCR